MLLLVVDTSGKGGSIALARSESSGNCDVLDTARLDGGAFSAQLIPQIESLLSKHGFTKSEIAGFIAVSGPGSFTGLRVGLAAVKALAEVLAKPIAAVSLLEAVALAGGVKGPVIAAMDAGRQQIYVGEYYVLSDQARCEKEELVNRDEFACLVAETQVITPDSRIADLAKSCGGAVRLINGPEITRIAQIGYKKILTGATVLPEALEANYIVRSDAEIFTKIS